MVDKIEMSLDDIIKTNKIGFRRPGGAGGRKATNANAGGGGGQRRNNNNLTTKFRGTTNRQIGNNARPKGRARGVPQTRNFSRVRNTT